MIAIIVRELSYLKVLYPIIQLLPNAVVFYADWGMGEKNYNRPTLDRLRQYLPTHKLIPFKNDAHLIKQLIANKITKLISVEIGLWARSYVSQLKQNNIKTYSLLFLTDSLWVDSSSVVCVDRVYYATKYLMDTYLTYSNTKYNPTRDRCLGSPIFDCIEQRNYGKDVLVLLPNLRQEHIKEAFGSEQNYIKIISKLGSGLIYKTRVKQYLPKAIEQYAKEIIYDTKQYPTDISDILKRTYCTVMFHSSGIYECVYGGNSILNVQLPLKRWRWDREKLKKYFTDEKYSVYFHKNLVKSIAQDEVLKYGWQFKPQRADEKETKEWVDRFIGETKNSAELIVKDILNG